MGKLMSRFGSAAMLAGASIFVIGGQATVHASNPTPPSCNDSTSYSPYGSLSNYYFTVDGTDYCSLQGHVSDGSTVVAHLTVPEEDTAAPDTQSIFQVTLASYNVPDGDPSNLNDQVVDECASTNSTNNSACTGGTYDASADTLTVTVPDCAFQVDFAFGPVVTTFNTNVTPPVRYNVPGHDRLIDWDTGSHDGTCSTPTPSTSPSSSTSPSGGVQGITSSASPTTTPTGSVQGISTPSTGAGAGSSLGVDLIAFALLFLGFISVGLARRQPVELS
jgi:hypothetical protein